MLREKRMCPHDRSFNCWIRTHAHLIQLLSVNHNQTLLELVLSPFFLLSMLSIFMLAQSVLDRCHLTTLRTRPKESPICCTWYHFIWRVPWMEEPGRLPSMGSLGVRHDWKTSLSFFTFLHWRRKWQTTTVFLPGESQGQGSLVGCHLWGQTQLKWLSSSSSMVFIGNLVKLHNRWVKYKHHLYTFEIWIYRNSSWINYLIRTIFPFVFIFLYVHEWKHSLEPWNYGVA